MNSTLDFNNPEPPKQHFLIYTNTSYYMVLATEDEVWERQQKYIQQKMKEGARINQIQFVYIPVRYTLLPGVK